MLHKRRNSFAPQIEGLEERTVLSTATFNSATGLLQISGTNLNDRIKIVDSGSPTLAGAIKVFDNGVLIFSSPAGGGGVSSVKNIDVDTFEGDDTVRYKLAGPALFANRAMDVDLGDGADKFNANVAGGLGFGANLLFNVLGQAGNDQLTGTMNGEVSGPFFAVPASKLDFVFDGGDDQDTMIVTLHGSVKSGAHLGVDLHGGLDNDIVRINALKENVAQNGDLNLGARGQAGEDLVAVKYIGQLRGTLTLQEGGGPDADVMRGNLLLKAGSDGSLNSGMNGGPGNDDMRMFVRKQVAADPATIVATVDGGPDVDTLQKTANVTDTNCETVTIVP